MDCLCMQTSRFFISSIAGLELIFPIWYCGLSKLAQIRTETLHLSLRDDKKGRHLDLNQYVFLMEDLGNAFASKGMQKYHQHPQWIYFGAERAARLHIWSATEAICIQSVEMGFIFFLRSLTPLVPCGLPSQFCCICSFFDYQEESSIYCAKCPWSETKFGFFHSDQLWLYPQCPLIKGSLVIQDFDETKFKGWK